MNNPLVSIIVPVYNVEQYLKVFVNAIKAQTFKNFELIMVDDGSVDNSLEILREAAALDNRFKVVSKENQGTGEARNTGIACSSGKYLLFLDPDDTISEKLLEDNVLLLESKKADIVVFGYDVYIDNNIVKEKFFNNVKKGVLTDGTIFTEYFSIGVFDTLWNKMIKADIIKDNNVFSPSWPIAEDRGLLLGIAKFKPNIIFNNNKKAYYHYNFKRPGSTVAKFNPSSIDSVSKSINMIFSLFELWNEPIPIKLAFLTLVNSLYFDAGLLNLSRLSSNERNTYLKKLNKMNELKKLDSYSIIKWLKVLNLKELIKLFVVKYRLGGIIVNMMKSNKRKF